MISQEDLKKLIHYEPETGVFTWRRRHTNAIKPNLVAGGRHSRGYWTVRIMNKQVLAHRLAWFYVHGVWPEAEIDHKNRNRADNRLCNLREATNKQNSKNTGTRANSTTAVTGVHLYKGEGRVKRYWAYITVDCRRKSLGYFYTLEGAKEARREAELRLLGQWAPN